MDDEQITIKPIKVKDLPSFAAEVIHAAKKNQFVPISMQRAQAHAHNPYADGDDVGLLVAFDKNDEIVGYFGILPVKVRNRHRIDKVHWFTTWNVSGKVRGKGVGSKLMEAALALSKDFVIVGSVYARKVCRKFGFLEKEPLVYYWLDMTGGNRLNPVTGLLRLYRRGRRILGLQYEQVAITNHLTKRFARLLSPVFKRIFYPLLSKQTQSALAGLNVRKVERLQTQFAGYEHRPDVEFYRDIDAINWMIRYPWVVPSGESPTEEMDYYFSDVRPFFEFIPLEVFRDDGQFAGYLVFSVSGYGETTSLKVLDYDYRDEKMADSFFALAVQFGRTYNADRLEIPAEFAGGIRKGFPGRLLLYEKKRIYQCSPKSEDSPLHKAWDKLVFHLADGDMPFS